MQRAKVSKKNKYFIEQHEYYLVKHFAYCYKYWNKRLQEIGGGEHGISYDGAPGGTRMTKQVEEIAIKREAISSKVDLIERTCREVGGGLYKWLIVGVTDRSAGYEYLRNVMGIPCGRRQYYQLQRRFYYTLYKKIMGEE